MTRFTNKQQAFISEYPIDFNATQAALRAGYSPRTAYSMGHENLKKPEIMAEIDRVLEKRVMSRNEALFRLASQAKSDLGAFADFFKPDHNGVQRFDWQKAKAAGLTYLIKKFKSTRDGDQIELYDAQTALVHVGRHYKLFTDKIEVKDWKTEVLDMLRLGQISPGDVEDELGTDLAREFFESAGLDFVGIGAPAAESTKE